MTEPTPEIVRWAVKAVGPGAAAQNTRRLAGSTTSTLYALDIVQGAAALPCVLRVYDYAGYLESETDAPRREAAALTKAFAAGLAAPALIACDPEGDETDSVPKLLMTRLPGQPILVPDNLDRWLHALAAALLPIHAVSADGFPWRYAPYADLAHLTPPRWSRIPHGWEQAIALVQEPPPPAPECFIHRDYHPNNVLWQNEKITGIVDWPSACRGVAHVDVSWCRENLMSLYGVPAADAFLAAYQAEAGPSFIYHPHWDLLALMEELPGPPKFYPPWADFGLPHLPAELLRERADDYLESVLRRLQRI